MLNGSITIKQVHKSINNCCKKNISDELINAFSPGARFNEVFSKIILECIEVYSKVLLFNLLEKSNILFGVLECREPFWGLSKLNLCPDCQVETFLIVVDAKMIILIDQLTSQLNNLAVSGYKDNLLFEEPTVKQIDLAHEVLEAVIRDPHSKRVSERLLKSGFPYSALEEAKRIGWVLLFLHEACHLLGDNMESNFGVNCDIRLFLEKLNLINKSSFNWNEEYWADANSFILLAIQAEKNSFRPGMYDQWCKALPCGFGINFFAWDYLIAAHNFGFGNQGNNLSHPPMKLRLINIMGLVHEVSKKHSIGVDNEWLLNVAVALTKLHR